MRELAQVTILDYFYTHWLLEIAELKIMKKNVLFYQRLIKTNLISKVFRKLCDPTRPGPDYLIF